jgi:hypothetical protein
MQDHTISIPFNRQSYLKKQRIVWALILKTVLVSYIIYTIVTVMVLGTGIAIDSKGGLPLISLLGIIMLITIVLKYRALYTTRKSFYAKARHIAYYYERESIIQTYTFASDALHYTDQHKQLKLSWSLFEPVTTVKNVLILRTKYDEQIILLLSDEDVDTATYREVLGVLTEMTGSGD